MPCGTSWPRSHSCACALLWCRRSRSATPIRCHFGRYSPEPCENPATVDVSGPFPKLYCEEHARCHLEERFPEGWAEYGAEKYARYCEEAATLLHRHLKLEGGDGQLDNPVPFDMLEAAHAYLDRYELVRARRRLVAEGETPHPTSAEMERLEFAQSWFSWGDLRELPPWVSRVEAWAEHAEREKESRCA